MNFLNSGEQLGCEAYVNGNLGSGTVQEMSEWVEYITFEGVSPMADSVRKTDMRNHGNWISLELEMKTGDVAEI